MKRGARSVAGNSAIEECFSGFTPTTYRQRFLVRSKIRYGIMHLKACGLVIYSSD
jgi:hypothetical protein